MQSKAATVGEYLASLPAERRNALLEVREVILRNLDRNYEEGMSYGMITYCVPHRLFPAGYHCDPKQPLPFLALASQKNYMSVYLMPDSPWFREAWAKTGKKLDMGKCCIRFKKVEDLALDVLGEAIRRIPAKRWIQIYTESRAAAGAADQKGGRRKGARKAKAARTAPAKPRRAVKR